MLFFFVIPTLVVGVCGGITTLLPLIVAHVVGEILSCVNTNLLFYPSRDQSSCGIPSTFHMVGRRYPPVSHTLKQLVSGRESPPPPKNASGREGKPGHAPPPQITPPPLSTVSQPAGSVECTTTTTIPQNKGAVELVLED